ncbi:unnamed protein product [Allacma fusca]|uniref:Uncharacterized protein n=1 Tax=Allacma fusca TaxID=39272 RepID=A0A8J2K8D0_9HEXA|nr:unnamed protein product [Allacma fusca]
MLMKHIFQSKAQEAKKVSEIPAPQVAPTSTTLSSPGRPFVYTHVSVEPPKSATASSVALTLPNCTPKDEKS